MSLKQLLRASDALADLADDELDAFVALGESRHIAPGAVVQARRAPWTGLFVLLDGALRASDQHDSARYLPRGTLPEWSAALSGQPSDAHYVAPWGGAHVITWPRAVVDNFFSQRPHLLGLVRQRVDALPSPRPTGAGPQGAMVPLQVEMSPRRGTASWRQTAMRWRLQTDAQKAGSWAALVALTLAQWMPMMYVRYVVDAELAQQHHTRVWVLGIACAWAVATLMGLVPWRHRGGAPAGRAMRLWLLHIGMVACSAWLAVAAWPMALTLCCGQLVCGLCAWRLAGLRNHRHPTYIVLQSRSLNQKTNRWRNIARLTNLATTAALVLTGARALQTGRVDLGDFMAAEFLGMLMQHAWRESFTHTIIVEGAVGAPMAPHQASIMAAPDISIAPGQRLGVVGVSGSGLSWTAASAAHCVALPSAIVPVHAPLMNGTLRSFLGAADDAEGLSQALRWVGADRIVAGLQGGLSARVTRFDPRLSLQQRVCLHAARLILQSPAGIVFDACLDLIDPALAQVLLTNLACALPHTRMSIVTHQADILRRCHRVAVLAPNQTPQEGEFYGLWRQGQLSPLTYHGHA